MKTIKSLVATLMVLMPFIALAAPSERTAKTTVTGVVVDHDHGLLILKEFRGWDRKLTEAASQVLKDRKTLKWLSSFDNSHAVIIIKAEDAKTIRNGSEITIEGYSYSYDEWDFYPKYDKVTIAKPTKKGGRTKRPS